MYFRVTLVVIILICIGCNRAAEEGVGNDIKGMATEVKFDKIKWQTKVDSDYPYRDQMLHDIVYNDSIRALKKNGLLALLGEPDRSNEGHLYYMISQNKLGFWPLNTKTLVIKLTEGDTIDWIKIHE